MIRVLLLGGTTEASQMARRLRDDGVDAVFSYAGRTAAPAAQPLPVRIGGFGGACGLADYLAREAISHVIDATHPFAAQMSRNAVKACAAHTPLAALEREPWRPGPADDWRSAPDVAAAVAALPEAPSRIFLAIGKQMLEAFKARAEHFYLLRMVDPPLEPPPFRDAHVVLARGPFDEAADLALMRAHDITHVVAKNSGGVGARAKLDAARALGLPVILIQRPHVPPRPLLRGVDEAMAWLQGARAHGAGSASAERGV